jgi:hypothetical protein
MISSQKTPKIKFHKTIPKFFKNTAVNLQNILREPLKPGIAKKYSFLILIKIQIYKK